MTSIRGRLTSEATPFERTHKYIHMGESHAKFTKFMPNYVFGIKFMKFMKFLSFHVILHHFTSFRVILCHFTSFRVILRHFMSFGVKNTSFSFNNASFWFKKCKCHLWSFKVTISYHLYENLVFIRVKISFLKMPNLKTNKSFEMHYGKDWKIQVFQ